MSHDLSRQSPARASGVPSAREFTSSPLRNRIRVELEAGVSEVWELLGAEMRVWIEPVAKQLDTVAAIGDFYRFDRFASPAKLWDDLHARFPELLNTA